MPPATVPWADFVRMSKRANVAEAQRDEAWSIATDHMEAIARGDSNRSGLTVVQELIPILRQNCEREEAAEVDEPRESEHTKALRDLRSMLVDARGFVESHPAHSAPGMVERIDRALLGLQSSQGATGGERSPGVEMIEKERVRQVVEEGYDKEHDDDHVGQAIARAAAAYAAPHRLLMEERFRDSVEYTDTWPWTADDDKRHHRPWTLQELEDSALRHVRVRELVKAGALIAAEIDRLERMP